MLRAFSRKEINRRLPVTLKMVGLQDKGDRFPSQLSGGEQQRASIARAVVGTPPLLLADEPTGNLDSDNARQVINILRKLNSIGITVVVTTHDEEMVRQLSYPGHSNSQPSSLQLSLAFRPAENGVADLDN